MFFKHNDTIIDHIEMALRGGCRKARKIIPTEAFTKDPRQVDQIILTHARTFLEPLYPDSIVTDNVDGASKHGCAWLMDPFDGPMNEHNQAWRGASTLAYLRDGDVLAAGVYDLSRGVIYIAAEDDGKFVIDENGNREWLRVTMRPEPHTPLPKPRCLRIMDVICCTDHIFEARCDDPLDFIAAGFVAWRAGCVVRDEHGMPWGFDSKLIVVASDTLAYNRHRLKRTPAH